ncbi:MAG: RnfABCDGE type electron transport complex subunit D [Coriobacteriales bacterium]|nr:RnfABCDGE type electron transport complex subunit D [Coriobacteriales bacterium]MDO5708814.1 RnfABCDGE type electron transport complex subunit D [Coriobacteriales bacterium]
MPDKVPDQQNPANNPLVLRPAPQISSAVTTHIIMRDVLVALAPATIAAIAFFGLRAFSVIATSVTCCVLFEYLWCRLRGLPNTTGDLSAAITGLLLAFNVPSTLPLYMVALGAFVAIIMTKELFGGIGKNFANPAIVARIFLAVAFPVAMTTFVPANQLIPFAGAADIMSSATPLSPAAEPTSYLQLLLGQHAGVLGETSALALLLGMIFLLVRPVITWHIPVAYMGTVAVLSVLAGKDPIFQLLSGGLVLGAIYMATDYSTCPATKRGKLVFGVGCGIITCLIRFYGNLNEGVAYSILFMNLLVPYIDQLTPNIPVGGELIMAERRRAKAKGGNSHE